MELLEREAHLRELHRALAYAAGGQGLTVLVTGEAGIGKTSLVERFANEAGEQARVLWGACEALFTPRPLGPLHDMVHALGGELLAELKRNARPVDLFHGLLDVVRSGARPTAMVVEDVHWADHGTLDFIKFLARRVPKLPATLVLTYRDDEIGGEHPLATVLGELPADNRVRLKLPALSREAVELLGREAGRAVQDLYRVTGGNPFFVTELLREGGEGLATTVRDAVLARAKALSPPARALLDLLSVVPDRVELPLLELLGSAGPELEECIGRGLLRLDPESVSFRHELARMAVEDALSSTKRKSLNRCIFEALAPRPADPRTLTRLAHHAIAANHAEGTLRFAPLAAQAASERGAHREAIALLNAILPHASLLPLRERAGFHDTLVYAHFLVGQPAEAIEASETAYHLWNQVGDDLAKGRNIVRRFSFPWAVREYLLAKRTDGGRDSAAPACAAAPDDTSRVADMRRLIDEAIALLGRFRIGPELALANATVAILATLDDRDDVVCYRDKALDLTPCCTADEDLAEVLARIALAEWVCCGAPRESTLERLMHHSRAAKIDRRIVTAFGFDGMRRFLCGELDAAHRAVAEGLRFVRDRQLEDFQQTHILSGIQAAVEMARGDWSAAEAHYESIFLRPRVPRFMVSRSRLQCALLAARRGRPFDRAWLADAFAAGSIHLLHDLYRLHRTHGEIAWLTGDTQEARRSSHIASCIARKWDHPWLRGEAQLLARLVGAQADASGAVAEPYALLFAGHWRDAARSWKRLGYPYEEALALAFGDEGGQREALQILDSLGAKAVAEQVRRRMREGGVRSIPRGPIARTQSNPAGLTSRELQVLTLLADGLSNSAIARCIHRSVKTVDHHVSAVIDKLGARGRAQAVGIARQRNLLAKSE